MPNIYFFHGPDTYRALKTLNEWKRVFEKKYGPGSVRELPASPEPYHLSELSGGVSLFNRVTLNVIQNPFGSAEAEPALDIDDFLQYGQGETSAANHFLLWQRGSLDKRLNAVKSVLALAKSGKIKIYEYNFLSAEEALPFIASEFKKYGLKIKHDAGQKLSQYTATPDGQLDTWAAANAVSVLAGFAAGANEIKIEDVDAVIAPGNPEDAFLPLLRSFANRNAADFLRNLESLTAAAEADNQILGALAALFEQVKNMLAVKKLSQKGLNLVEIEESLGFKKGRARYLQADAQHFDEKELLNLLEKLLEIEYNIKQGQVPAASGLVSLAAVK